MRYSIAIFPATARGVEQAPPQEFKEFFSSVASPRGRGGDLDPSVWSVGRLVPYGISTDRVNHIRHATIPVCRAGISSTSVYPPDDMLVCDATSSLPGTLMTGIVIQNYGNHDFMSRRPFDFAGRTGKFYCDVDMVCEGALGAYIQLSITDDPITCPSFLIANNNETGPIPKNGIMIAFSLENGGGANTGVGSVWVYTNYSGVEITPTFQLTGANMPTTQQDKLNHIEVLVSETTLEVWASDKTPDGTSFPNFRKIWAGSITAPMTRGYVHFAARNHATVKYGFAATHVYHWDNCGFDGPVLPTPRAYEIPDNTTTGTSTDNSELDYPYAYMNLGYELSDGTGRAEGIWSPTSNISPFTISGVDLTGKTSAKITLALFFNTISHTADTTWGIKHKLNSNAWRTRNLTSAEVTAINTNGTAGCLLMVIDVTFSDLVQGTNTLDFSTVNAPQDYVPLIQNIDLLLS